MEPEYNNRFSRRDIEDIESRGLTVASVLNDLETFVKGFPFLEVVAPAIPPDEIRVLTHDEQEKATELFFEYKGSVCKFVPASGAATRMFKELFETMDGPGSDRSVSAAERLKDSIGRFAFYDDLKAFYTFDEKEALSCTEHLLTDKGLNYSSMPKGLLKFHKYTTDVRTAFEEHLVEGARYAAGKDSVVRMVVTVSPGHIDSFRAVYQNVKGIYEKRYNVIYDVKFTLQKASTDKIAVDLENKPFRQDDGTLLFRPAGHGALIENLNEIEEDLVFVKNIDNVIHEKYLEESVRWKRVLAGVLIDIRNKVFAYQEALDYDDSPELLEEVAGFMKRELSVTIPSLPEPLEKLFIKEKLNRPVRVCGMVKNQGEPGGGPFIARDPDGSSSPQILESAQLDFSEPLVEDIVRRSTHFNPVDIVCYLKNYKGEKFDLHKYIDRDTGFISTKSIHGKKLKALELPGLWNGAMSQWNTVFVEVPLITFNPVKTVFDLLRKEHID
jgi:hypothetical protein